MALRQPNIYVCRMLFQAQMSRAKNPVNLSLERHYFNLSVSIQSLSVFLKYFFEGMCLCLKSFTRSAVEWMSTNPLSMLVSLPQMSKVSPPTKANAFLRLQKIFAFVLNGLPQTTARTFVWSPRESIGFPFATSWNRHAMSFLLTRNTSRRSRAKKQTRRMQNGSRISSSTILFREALFLLLTFVSFGTWFATDGNSSILLSVKRTAHKTVLPSPTSNWMTFSPMFLERLPLTSSLGC